MLFPSSGILLSLGGMRLPGLMVQLVVVMSPWDELDFLGRNPWAYRLSYYQRLLWERKLQLQHGLNYILARLLLGQYKVTIAELRELLSTGEGVKKLMTYYTPPSMEITHPEAKPGENPRESLKDWLREKYEEEELRGLLRREKRRNREKRRKALLYKLLLDEEKLRVGEARAKFNNNKPGMDTVKRWLDEFVSLGLAEKAGRGLYVLAYEDGGVSLSRMVERELRAYLLWKAAKGGVHRNTLGRWMKNLMELGIASRIGHGYYERSPWLCNFQGRLDEAISMEIERRREESLSSSRVTEEEKERIRKSCTWRWRRILHDELARKELGLK